MKDCRSTCSGFHQYSIFNLAISRDQCSIQLGFTLLELLVVLVIIGVMAAFVGPRIAGSISNTNLKSASKRIAAALRYARSQAISESTTYVVLFDLDKNSVAIEGGQTAREDEEKDDGDRDQDNRRHSMRYRLPEDVRLDKAIWGEDESDSGLFRIIFLSNGGSSGGELILINDRGHRYGVTVDFITGTVRVGRDEA